MTSNRRNEILKSVKGDSILHIGCADHHVRETSDYWLHKHLVDQFSDVHGIDISKENINKMKNLGYNNLHVQSAEDFHLGLVFDTIIAGELIEHLSNPGLFFESVREHLKPEGRLIITTPYPFSLLNILYSYLKFPKTCQNEEHSMWFCISTIRTLASRYGYQEVSYKLIQDYELDNPSIPYRILSYFLVYLGFLFPKPLKCNNMIFAFEPKIDYKP
jgi:2-polyprenyl-3-methyl-5-hydroxy-6-metoxy-1,4-benzoquinol methylase